MSYKIYLQIVIIFATVQVNGQHVVGTLTNHANQEVELIGYNGFDTYVIDAAQANEEGVFNLSFSEKDYGMAYLQSENEKSMIVLLAKDENLRLHGKDLASPETVEITAGKQNQLFEQYASEHPRREQALSAWKYLANIYKSDSLFSVHETPRKAIANEQQRIKAEDSLFLAGLPEGAYISYYLPLRKLISSVSTIAQYRTEEIPATINAFRGVDYTDQRLQKSGLLQDAIESHFWLIENSGRSLDSVYIEMNKSIDALVNNLLTDQDKLNEITEYLFKLLEKRSLFTSSAYLAIKLLNENACTLENNFANQLESYRAMKKGNTAPDIAFAGEVIAPGYNAGSTPKMLSDIKSKYTVILFGASWCPLCPQELLTISGHYKKWKELGLEVVFISLDVDKERFKNLAEPFPFISICDYKKWDSQAVKDYYVFATPSMYLLDSKRRIMLRPNSVRHLKAWVDQNLVQGDAMNEFN